MRTFRREKTHTAGGVLNCAKRRSGNALDYLSHVRFHKAESQELSEWASNGLSSCINCFQGWFCFVTRREHKESTITSKSFTVKSGQVFFIFNLFIYFCSEYFWNFIGKKEQCSILLSSQGSGGTFSKHLNNSAKTKINLFHTTHAVETKPLC